MHRIFSIVPPSVFSIVIYTTSTDENDGIRGSSSCVGIENFVAVVYFESGRGVHVSSFHMYSFLLIFALVHQDTN